MGVSSKLDRVPFYPYYVFKDLVGFFVFFLILSIFVFFFPNALGQWAAVLWSNPEYYDSTMCWNSFYLLGTWDVRRQHSCCSLRFLRSLGHMQLPVDRARLPRLVCNRTGTGHEKTPSENSTKS
jgi:hypothetical protein